MTILALEFSSEQRSVAVARNGIVLAEAMENGGRHTAAFGMIDKVLKQAGIGREEVETLAIGLGPGSYTGIRGAIALAQGWQLARNVKAVGISSVAAIAAGAQTTKIFGRVKVIINAQREEFYLAEYEIDADRQREIVPLKIVPRVDIQAQADNNEVLIGPEAMQFSAHSRQMFPHAADLGRLAMDSANTIPGEKLEPIYLRETNFVKVAK